MDALAETMNPIIRDCGGFCGFLSVGFSGGCATVVETSNLHPGWASGMEACVRRYFFTHRFDCAPADGWASLYVGACPD
jgi:hypothetical protein